VLHLLRLAPHAKRCCVGVVPWLSRFAGGPMLHRRVCVIAANFLPHTRHFSWSLWLFTLLR